MKQKIIVGILLLAHFNHLIAWNIPDEKVSALTYEFHKIWDDLENKAENKSFEEINTLVSTSINFDQFLNLATTQNAADASEFITTVKLLLTHALYENEKELLNWCLCIEASYRLTLIILLLQDVKNNFTKKQQITMTSLGSGELLQDYLLGILVLNEGYGNLTFNLIDLGYPQIIDFEKDIQKHLARIKGIPALKKLYAQLSDATFINNLVALKNADQAQKFFTQQGLTTLSNKFLRKIAAAKTREEIIMLISDELEDAKKENVLEQVDQMRTKLYAFAFSKKMNKPIITLNIYTNATEYIDREKTRSHQQRKRPLRKELFYMVDPGIEIASAGKYPSQANSIGITDEHKNSSLIFIPPTEKIYQYQSSHFNKKSKQRITKILESNKTSPNKRAKIINELIKAFPNTATLYSEPHSSFQTLLKDIPRSQYFAHVLIHTDYKSPAKKTAELYKISRNDYLKLDLITPYIGKYIEANYLPQLKALPPL